jgi:hypothetical protein
MPKHVPMIAFVALIAAALVAAACGDDNTKTASTASNASQASVDDLTARIQRNEQLFAAVTIGNVPLHDMDESIKAGTIEASFVPNVRTVVRLLALTNWSATLKADADALHGHAVDLLRALSDADVAAAKAPSEALHDGWHEFSDKLWGELAKDLPPDAGGVAPDDAEMTPAAAGTATSH